jgi:outer membrane lipoprotein-sorting protein
LFAHGQQLTGKEIIKRMDSLLWGQSSYGNFELQIETQRWKRTLELRAWEKDRKKTFIRILGPAKEKGIATLRIEYEMWNYLPAVEKTIKVPPSMMFQPWMGSDFTNDDIVKESSIVEDYEHEILGIEDIDGADAYKIESLPKPEAPVVWGKIIYWVRKKDFVPLKKEFYSEKGERIRVLSFSEVKNMGGRTIPTVWEMKPLKKEGKRTVFKINEISYDIPIDDNIFSLENLRNPK